MTDKSKWRASTKAAIGAFVLTTLTAFAGTPLDGNEACILYLALIGFFGGVEA